MDALRIAEDLFITGTELCLAYRYREAVYLLEKARKIVGINEGYTSKQLEGHVNLILALAYNNLNDYHKAMQSATRAMMSPTVICRWEYHTRAPKGSGVFRKG